MPLKPNDTVVLSDRLYCVLTNSKRGKLLSAALDGRPPVFTSRVAAKRYRDGLLPEVRKDTKIGRVLDVTVVVL